MLVVQRKWELVTSGMNFFFAHLFLLIAAVHQLAVCQMNLRMVCPCLSRLPSTNLY